MQSNSQAGGWSNSLTWINSKLSNWWPHHQTQQNIAQSLSQFEGKQVCPHSPTEDNKNCIKNKDKGNQQGVDHKMKVLARLRSGNLEHSLESKMKRITDYFGAKQNSESAKPCDLLCPVCLQFMTRPVLTACGHNFCMGCLDETLLFKPDCPSCRNYLRGSKIIQCESLAKIVLRVVHKYGQQETQAHLASLRECDKWMHERTLRAQDIGVGMKIDVRDTQYIWCRAVIKQVYDLHRPESTSILIHYMGWNPIYDQIIDTKNSDRLARAGFYTDRTQLPHYRATENQEERMYSYVINSSNESEFLLGEFAMMNGQIGMAGIGGVGGFSFDILGLNGHNVNSAQDSLNLLEDIEQQSNDDEQDNHHANNIMPLSFDFEFDLNMNLHNQDEQYSFGSFNAGEMPQQQINEQQYSINMYGQSLEQARRIMHQSSDQVYNSSSEQNTSNICENSKQINNNFMNNLENIELELQEYNVHLASLMSQFRIQHPNIIRHEIQLQGSEPVLDKQQQQQKQIQTVIQQQISNSKLQIKSDLMVYSLQLFQDTNKKSKQQRKQNPEQVDDQPDSLI